MCKSAERMVNERPVCYLEENGLLANKHCCYGANIDNLIRFKTYISDVFLPQNQHLAVVFLVSQKGVSYHMEIRYPSKIYIAWAYEEIAHFYLQHFFLSDKVFKFI